MHKPTSAEITDLAKHSFANAYKMKTSIVSDGMCLNDRYLYPAVH